MSKPTPLSATKTTVRAPRSSAPTRISGLSVLQVNFQVRRSLDAPVRRVEPAAVQRPQHQLGVVFGVLDDQDFDRLVHAVWRSGGG